jgi:hypothetical protein
MRPLRSEAAADASGQMLDHPLACGAEAMVGESGAAYHQLRRSSFARAREKATLQIIWNSALLVLLALLFSEIRRRL